MKLIYVFYPDVFFIHNLVANWGILLISYFVFNISIKKNIKRLIIAPTLISLLMTVSVIAWKDYWISYFINLFLGVALIKYIGFKDKKESIKKYIVLLVSSFVLYGTTAIVGEETPYIFAAALISAFGINYILQLNRSKRYMYEITVLGDEGSMCECLGLYDSGNRLKEPNSGRAVHIADPSILGRIKVDEEKKLMVAFQSLGSKEGVLEVYETQEIIIHKNSKDIHLEKALIGIDINQLLAEKKYKLILNERI